MLGTRHEEYTNFAGDLPFRLFEDICITPKTRRSTANWHTNLELKLCTGGIGRVLLDGTVVPFEEGDVVVCNSGVLHHTDADTMVRYTALIVDTKFCKQVCIDPQTLRFSQRITDPSFLASLLALIAAYHADSDPLHTAKCYQRLLELLITLREDYTQDAGEYTVKDREIAAVEQIIGYIREHYAQKLSLECLARQCLTDKYTLSRSFKRVTGQTVLHYIHQFRCQKAAEHLKDGLSVSEAATLCGFTNMSFFTKTFKTHMGKMPSEYKRGK